MRVRRTARTRLLAGILALSLLASCGTGTGTGTGAGSGSPPAAGGRTVTVTGDGGPVRVPVTRQGIWALDAAAALFLLAIGVVPEHVATDDDGSAMAAATRELLTDAGAKLVEPSRLEQVAAADPALIVGTKFYDHDKLRPKLERIAPVLVVRHDRPWEESLAAFGTATGRSARAEEVAGRFDRAIAALAARVDRTRHAGASVSVLSGCPGELYCVYDSRILLGTVLARLGFERPARQARGDNSDYGYSGISAELLSGQRADIVIELSGSITDGRSPLEDPLLDTSGAVTGRVDFTAWFSTTPLSAWWILHDVRAVVLGDGEPATKADVPDLWAEVTGVRR